MLTAERLRELLHYDPETGVFVWRTAHPLCLFKAGDIAGGITDRGYRKIKADGRKYRANRLAWLYVTGEWPAHEIDHKNGNKADDSWVNLRGATRVQNMRNQRMHATNTSGVTGVCRAGRKWAAYIGGGADRKQIQLGKFDDFDRAVAARRSAEVRLWGGGHLQQQGT